MLNDTSFWIQSFFLVLLFFSCMMLLWTSNLVRLSLLFFLTLISVAGLYFCLGNDFLAVSQLLLYGAGVVMLMIFSLMVTGGFDSQIPINSLRRFFLAPLMGSLKTHSLALILGLSFLAFFYQSFTKYLLPFLHTLPIEKNNAEIISFSKIAGMLLLTDYLLVFELASLFLLGCLVGAAYIGRSTDEL